MAGRVRLFEQVVRPPQVKDACEVEAGFVSRRERIDGFVLYSPTSLLMPAALRASPPCSPSGLKWAPRLWEENGDARVRGRS